MEKKLNTSQKRALQYWFVDGLAELTGGVMCIILAIYFGIISLMPDSGWATTILFVIVFGLAFITRWLIQRIRQRYTYPRTGYVAPKSGWEDRRQMIISIVFTLLLLLAMIYLILTRGEGALELTPMIGGVILAFIFSMAGLETKLIRFIYLAIFCLLLGAVLAFSSLSNFWGAAILSLSTSLVLFAYGIITRRAYLRQMPMNVEAPDER